MKRSFLSALGLEKDIVDQIMSEHGNTIETLKEKTKEDTERQSQKLKEKIEVLQEKLDSTASQIDGEDWKSKYDMLQQKYDADVAAKQKEYEDFKATIESEKLTATKRSILHKKLESAGANPKVIDLLESKFDLGKMELENDTIKGFDNLLKPIKEGYADLFTVVEQKGFEPGNPPPNNPGTPYTLEQIKRMSPAEINANWDKGVKQVLEKGR